jgi:hypothetical protein
MPERSNIPPATLSELEAMFRPQRTVIGGTFEDDSTVQVVYRTRCPGGAEEEAGGVAVVSVRRTAAGWRLWSGSRDPALFNDQDTWFGITHVSTELEVQAELRERADRVLTWSLEGGGEGRAFVVGYTGGTEPPKAVAIEIQRPNARKVVVEIPIEQFGPVAELLLGWPEPNRKRD